LVIVYEQANSVWYSEQKADMIMMTGLGIVMLSILLAMGIIMVRRKIIRKRFHR